jgi:hypothetical protein
LVKIKSFDVIRTYTISKEDKVVKKTMIVTIGLLLIRAALAQNWVEERTYVSGNTATPRIDGLITHPIKGELGGFCWFQTQATYSQAYCGPTYSPKSWIQFALGSGIETNKHPARIGSYVWLGKQKLACLAAFENGGSGFWYKAEANYQIRKALGLGMLSERYHGTGPKFELLIPHTALKLWVAPLVSASSLHPVFGVRWSL